MKARKKAVEEAIDNIKDIFGSQSLQSFQKSQKTFEKALIILTKNKVNVKIKVTGKFQKKCFLCQISVFESDSLELSCKCFEYCHKTCIRGTALVMSSDLNPNNIRIPCQTCQTNIPFEIIQSCFSEKEIQEVNNKYYCKYCETKIPAETSLSNVKTCSCLQIYHLKCIKTHSQKVSRGLNKEELAKNFLCWHCKMPIPFNIVLECFNKKELKDIQDEELNFKCIEELKKQDKEDLKILARNKTIFCEVCEETKVVDKEIITLDCDHMFCKKCVADFAVANVKQNKVGEHHMICPKIGCKKPISFYILKEVMEKEMFVKYEDLIFQDQTKMIEGAEIILRCPKADCPNFFVMDKNSGIRFHTCELCKLEFCVNGCKEAHKNQTCEQYKEYLAELRRQEEERRLAEIRKIEEENKRQEEMKKFNEWKEMNDKADEQFNLLVAREKLANCPSCRIWGQKISGCNHITCHRCSYQYCYLCQAKWKTCKC